jgi:hypothetical protein
MAGYDFKPISAENLAEVAAFLYQQQEITSREDWTQARPSGDDLRWMLGNPHLRSDLPLGLILSSTEGKTAGMILSIPRLYRIEDETLLGLAAGDFFVDALARLQGFFLLRRFLATGGVDFWYANSCNRQSGPLWAKCGAAMVPESDVEYLLPIHVGPLAQELAIRKNWPAAFGAALRAASPLADLVAVARPRNSLALDYCTDLDRLAAIAERCRNRQLLQPDRSVAYLKWLYGSLREPEAADQTRRIYRFRSTAGDEGWFAVAHDRRGRTDQIRTTRVLDVIWPVDRMSFRDVLPALVEVARQSSDLLSIRGRIGLGLGTGRAARVRGLNRRSLLAPEGYFISRNPPTAELVGRADFPFADRY